MQKVTIAQRRAPLLSGESGALLAGVAVLPAPPPAAGALVHAVQTDGKADAEQAFFNDLYLLAPVGCCVLGLDSTILQLNVSGAELLGLPRSNPERLSLRHFVAPRFLDDFDRFVRAAFNHAAPQRCDLQLLRGANLHQQGLAVTLRACADGSGQALRVQIEPAEGKLAALERSEERLRRIVHCAEEGIWEIDASARTSFVNPKMAQLLGYAIEDMLDQPLVAFMDDEGRAILERSIASRQRAGARPSATNASSCAATAASCGSRWPSIRFSMARAPTWARWRWCPTSPTAAPPPS